MSDHDAKIKQGLRALATEYDDFCRKLHTRAMKLINGTHVRIVSDWNGQPYGTSKPSRKGKEFSVSGVSVVQGPAWVFVNIAEHPYDDSPRLDEVEFIR